MGANASTAVPLYAAGQVLDAARLNLTNSGIPVFSGTATRDAAFGGSGEKVLAEGQFAYLEDSNALQFYDSAAWQAVGGASGLTLISTTTVGTTVSSVTVSNVFSATYDNYKVIYSGGVASTGVDLQLTLGATTTGYFFSLGYIPWGATSVSAITNNNGASFGYAGGASTKFAFSNFDIFRPFASDETVITVSNANDSNAAFGGGYLNNSTSYTAFTLTPSSGTLTGGTIRVYGYQNS